MSYQTYQMEPEARKIKPYNVVAAAIPFIVLGVSFSILSLVTSLPGFDFYAVAGGLGFGVGLPALYLGAQWEKKTKAQINV
jgi:membrane associated rhomboid family serine protease